MFKGKRFEAGFWCRERLRSGWEMPFCWWELMKTWTRPIR
jgi:hypothetical protein